MNTRTLILGTALLAPLGLSARSAAPVPTTARATRIQFAPAEGTSLSKTFETKTQLTLDEHSISAAGAGTQQQPVEETTTYHQKLAITDEYVKVKNGMPRRLARTFDELSSESSASKKAAVLNQTDEHEQNMRFKSELEGKKVVFTWDAEKGEYKKTFDPAQAKDDLLAGLNEDMDLRCFLPENEVKDGEAWDVPLPGLREFIRLGGDLVFVPENADSKGLKMGKETGSMTRSLGDLQGTARAKLTGLKEIEGSKLAMIHIELRVHASADMTKEAQNMLKNAEPSVRDNVEIGHMDLAFQFEGEGDLAWDLGAGHFHGFDLSGQQVVKTETGMTAMVSGRKVDVTETMSRSGTATYSARTK